jgi:hypothetical protein
MVLCPAVLFCFTQKLVLIPYHLFGNQTLTDDGSLSGEAWAYFCSLRSGELTWRRDNHFHVEAYKPHRFAPQFSYFQGLIFLPTHIKTMGRVNTLERIQEAYMFFV